MRLPLTNLLGLWAVVLAGKFWYRTADADALRFVLAPTSKAMQLLHHLPCSWQAGEGYWLPEVAVLISKDCSGFNFLLIATLTAGFSLYGRFSSRPWLIPFSLLVAYGLTILANLARISLLVRLEGWITISPNLHLALGAATYLCTLIPFSLLLNSSACLPKPQPQAAV